VWPSLSCCLLLIDWLLEVSVVIKMVVTNIRICTETCINRTMKKKQTNIYIACKRLKSLVSNHHLKRKIIYAVCDFSTGPIASNE
jgi:hypothetical protein